MTDPTIAQPVLLPNLVDKPVVATFDREQASADGGAVLLEAAERVNGLVKAFAQCLVDKRAPEKIRHTLEDLIRSERITDLGINAHAAESQVALLAPGATEAVTWTVRNEARTGTGCDESWRRSRGSHRLPLRGRTVRLCVAAAA